MGKSIKIESRLVVTRGSVEGKSRIDLRSRGFSFGVIKIFWNLIEVLPNILNIPNTTELYPL